MKPKTALKPALPWLAAGAACAQTCGEPLSAVDYIKVQLQEMGVPIAFFMMLYMGIKWITAEGPEDRENARRGIIYVIIGTIMLVAGESLIEYLLC
jgi:hypothetical protein